MIDKIIDYFMLFCRSLQLSDRTISDYSNHLSQFKRHLPEDHPDDYRSGILSYLGDEKIKSPYTYNLRYAYLHRFFSWAIEEDFMKPPHPLKGLKKKKVSNKIISLTPTDIANLLTEMNARGGTFAVERDKAMLLLSIDGGYRPNELVSLMPNDIDFKSHLITIRASNAKTRIARAIPISLGVANVLRKFLSYHDVSWNCTLFPTQDGQKMSPITWNHRLREYGRTIGIKINPYQLRHYFATKSLSNDMNVFVLQRIMGHETLAMTQRYLSLSVTDLIDSHEKSSPANEILPVKGKRVRKIA